jgi:hypothetical protein
MAKQIQTIDKFVTKVTNHLLKDNVMNHTVTPLLSSEAPADHFVQIDMVAES